MDAGGEISRGASTGGLDAGAGGATGPSWPELLGSRHWSGILDPLHLDLRRLILRCGDLCQATYDAFNNDQNSPYCGSSRYGKRDFFRKVGLQPGLARDYEVAAFLYAASEAGAGCPGAFLSSLSREAWSKESNWIGYVAVSTDEASRALRRREIYVAWRGTIRSLEWVDVLKPDLVPVEQLLATQGPARHRDNSHWYDEVLHRVHDAVLGHVPGGVGAGHDHPQVMKGWHTVYTSSDARSSFSKRSARDQLLAKLRELVGLYGDEDLSVTLVGHSLGACLATLSAFDIVENGLSKAGGGGRPEFPVCAVVFGSPQVDDAAFAARLGRLSNLRVLHVRNEIDLIPLYPGGVLGYVSVGEQLVVDTRKSPYLKDSKNPSDWHNLQALLHAVAGWKGKEGSVSDDGEDAGFELAVKRSVALVNKSCGFLKEECLVPESWWVEKNKGMVMGDDGEWQLAPPVEDDVPVVEL